MLTFVDIDYLCSFVALIFCSHSPLPHANGCIHDTRDMVPALGESISQGFLQGVVRQ